MNTPQDVSIEYAHIYTNNKISKEHQLSLDVLGQVFSEDASDLRRSLVVMVDDYSFPDPSFDYNAFSQWLADQGYAPDVMIRESQLIPACDDMLKLVTAQGLREQITDYIRAKKYPCSLFVATWYLVRLGILISPVFDARFTAKRLVNILPLSFKPFEDKALEMIASTDHRHLVDHIEHRYFDGRLVA